MKALLIAVFASIVASAQPVNQPSTPLPSTVVQTNVSNTFTAAQTFSTITVTGRTTLAATTVSSLTVTNQSLLTGTTVLNGLDFVPSAAPTAAKGEVYFDSSLGGLEVSLNGSTFVGLSTGAVGNFVNLQGSTPGSQQSGNLNISGAGLFGGPNFSVGTSTLVILAGNVGIGTTNPGAALEVNGTTFFDGAVTAVSSVTVQSSMTVTNAVKISENTPITWGTVNNQSVASLVIGNIGPANAQRGSLWVTGGANSNQYTAGLGIYGDNSANASTEHIIGYGAQASASNGAIAMSVSTGTSVIEIARLVPLSPTAGGFGIGTTSPRATLEVNGTEFVDGATTFISSATFQGSGASTYSITTSSGIQVQSGTTQLFYCSGGTDSGWVLRGSGSTQAVACVTAGGTLVGEGIFVP